VYDVLKPRDSVKHAIYKTTHLCYPSNVLVPVLFGETQVLVKAEAHIVAIKAVCSESKMDEMLLKRCRNS
jgi:hypothetical protein